MKKNPNCRIHIARSAQGHITRSLFLSDSGTVFLVFKYSDVVPCCIWSVSGPDYHMELRITTTTCELERNGRAVVVDIPTGLQDSDHFILNVTWGVDNLAIGLLSKKGKEEKEIPTECTKPPEVLLHWLRKQSLRLRREFIDAKDFFDFVCVELAHYRDIIRKKNAVHAFWDTVYDGKKIRRRIPKRESDIHPTVDLLLSDLELRCGCQVQPESKQGSGRLDFLLSGETCQGRAHVCVEFKLAHARDLEHGLLSQLPEYMRRKSTDFGVYVVLDFGAGYKPNLSSFETNQLETALITATLDIAFGFVHPIVWDVSFQPSPSKL